MSKFDIVFKLKDGYEFRLDKLDRDILMLEEMKPVLTQWWSNFVNGLTANRPINVKDGNKRQYKYENLASITINFVEEGK
ncbi:hypothetical protein PTQ21_12350 [Paenibacillus marchantiae]|uniref:hypothetical protein n=1 Tax=Paenibacillus marchantiae TaxID=3026433 RepID=UPI00237B4431|nr:hypothetical protein [Paenibacillus marchantiae]WDQ34978.1 hypothetical protein PTQ21_12350 [Paenibacillus marchantiae]